MLEIRTEWQKKIVNGTVFTCELVSSAQKKNCAVDNEHRTFWHPECTGYLPVITPFPILRVKNMVAHLRKMLIYLNVLCKRWYMVYKILYINAYYTKDLKRWVRHANGLCMTKYYMKI